MSLLSNSILENASYWQTFWLNKECSKMEKTDSSSGRGQCVDIIKKQYAKGAENEGTPWCAQFVSVVIKTTYEKLKLPKSKLPYTASTLVMLDGAKKANLTVDKTPREGCIFFRYRSGGGHVGFVGKIDNNGTIYTIEGNASNAVVARTYNKENYKNWQFIHIQDEYEVNPVNYLFREKRKKILVFGGIAAFVGGGSYLLYRSKKKAIQKVLSDQIQKKETIQQLINTINPKPANTIANNNELLAESHQLS